MNWITRKICDWADRKRRSGFQTNFHVGTDLQVWFRESEADWTLEPLVTGFSYSRTVQRAYSWETKSGEHGKVKKVGHAGSLIMTMFTTPPRLYALLASGKTLHVMVKKIDEFGRGACMILDGVVSSNEGLGLAIDDVSSEIQVTYVASGSTTMLETMCEPAAPKNRMVRC